MAPPPRFCPQCAAALESSTGCARCAWINYVDPKLAVVVLVEDGLGRLLYVRRNHEPAMFRWCWPSGFVDAGERVEDAAVREVMEETGVQVEIGSLLGVWSQTGEQVVVVAYCGRPVGGGLRPGPEAFAAGWFPIQPVARRPTPVFTHDAEILESFLAPER